MSVVCSRPSALEKIIDQVEFENDDVHQQKIFGMARAMSGSSLQRFETPQSSIPFDLEMKSAGVIIKQKEIHP